MRILNLQRETNLKEHFKNKLNHEEISDSLLFNNPETQ